MLHRFKDILYRDMKLVRCSFSMWLVGLVAGLKNELYVSYKFLTLSNWIPEVTVLLLAVSFNVFMSTILILGSS